MSAKEDDVDVVDSPPNLPRDPIQNERSSSPRPLTPVSEPNTPKSHLVASTPIVALKKDTLLEEDAVDLSRASRLVFQKL